MNRFSASTIALAVALAPVATMAQLYGEASGNEMDSSLDAIVRTDSQGWAVNHYSAGSMRSSYIRSASPDGSSYVVRGSYTYTDGSSGWVEAHVVNGQLSCIEYWDTWFGCRAPNIPGGRNSYDGAIVTAALVGLAAALASSSSSSSSSGNHGAYRSSDGEDPASGGYSRPRQPDPAPREDTSVGCVWGDRAYGTCPH